jgi:DNA-binding response OmpR family regulator
MMECDPRELAAASQGKCILVVEDEMLLAMMLEDMLTDLGYCVVKAARVGKATEIAAAASIDCAILDVNLDGENSYPVAKELRRRNIPFVFSTGYGAAGLRSDYRDSPTLSKPYSHHDLQRILTAALASSAAGL